jgi:putative alpha-1,2-mannosidase
VTQAQNRWADQVFSKVFTTEANSTVLAMLYTYMYGMMIIPSNRTGENPLWTSSEPYYDDIFTYWDLFR